MAIRFNYKHARNCSLDSVEDNQFFINNDGYLCQKCNDGCYIYIADVDGVPRAGFCHVITTEPCVSKILPEVESITFEA